MNSINRQPIVVRRTERLRESQNRAPSVLANRYVPSIKDAGHRVETSIYQGRKSGLPADILNRFSGQSAFLIGGGPSFLGIDRKRLRDSPALTMTLNNAFSTYKSDLWLGVDPPKRFIRDIWKDHCVMKFTPRRHYSKLIRGKPAQFASSCPNVYFYKQDDWFKQEQMFASHDPSIWDNRNGHGCRTSLMDGIRLLYLLGIREIYLLGVDFYQSAESSYHYQKRTYQKGILQNNRLYKYMSARLGILRPLMEKSGLVIYNCNSDSRLRVFNFISFEHAISRVIEQYAFSEKQTPLPIFTEIS